MPRNIEPLLATLDAAGLDPAQNIPQAENAIRLGYLLKDLINTGPLIRYPHAIGNTFAIGGALRPICQLNAGPKGFRSHWVNASAITAGLVSVGVSDTNQVATSAGTLAPQHAWGGVVGAIMEAGTYVTLEGGMTKDVNQPFVTTDFPFDVYPGHFLWVRGSAVGAVIGVEFGFSEPL